MPTMHEVARKAGVSLGTVSNVLNHPELVADDTRDRVLRAIAALARQLRLLQSLRARAAGATSAPAPGPWSDRS